MRRSTFLDGKYSESLKNEITSHDDADQDFDVLYFNTMKSLKNNPLLPIAENDVEHKNVNSINSNLVKTLTRMFGALDSGPLINILESFKIKDFTILDRGIEVSLNHIKNINAFRASFVGISKCGRLCNTTVKEDSIFIDLIELSNQYMAIQRAHPIWDDYKGKKRKRMSESKESETVNDVSCEPSSKRIRIR